MYIRNKTFTTLEDFKKELNSVMEFSCNDTPIEVISCTFIYVNFNMDFGKCCFDNCKFTNCKFHRVDVSFFDFDSCLFDHCLFSYTDLAKCDISDSHFLYSYFYLCNMKQALFKNCSIYETEFNNCDMIGALFIDTPFPNVPMACPEEGEFIGYKLVAGIIRLHPDFDIYYPQRLILKLKIPADAKRSSSTGKKCRCDKAFVMEVLNYDGTVVDDDISELHSRYNSNFKYKVGECVTEPNFNPQRFVECTEGIHFFMNREDAINY